MYKLASCPICSSPPCLLFREHTGGYIISCSLCHLTLGLFDYDTRTSQSAEMLVSLWNRRPQDDTTYLLESKPTGFYGDKDD